MYKTITIGGVDYRQEYTIEASMSHECIEKLINFITGAAVAASVDVSGMTEEQAVKAVQDATKEGIRSMSDIPNVAMHVWYAGFLEYHGPEGDRSVMTMKDAKALYRKYREEHPEDSSFYDIITMCMEQMEADGFFDLIGLDKVLTPEQPKKRPKKTPQDHKRKVTPME